MAKVQQAMDAQEVTIQIDPKLSQLTCTGPFKKVGDDSNSLGNVDTDRKAFDNPAVLLTKMSSKEKSMAK